jgi:hypothetical protein
MSANRLRREGIMQELKERQGWIELGCVSGTVKGRVGSDAGSLEYGGMDLGELEPDHGFRQSLKGTIELTGPAELTRLFFLIVGPEVIFFTDHFLGRIFSGLDLTLRIGSTEREFALVQEGRVNRRDLTLMGEIRDWIIYLSKRWEGLPVDIDDVEVELEISGKTGIPPKDMGFGIGVFSKMEG